MKNILKVISISSLILFGILWLLSKFPNSFDFNTNDIQNVLVLAYLFTSLKYHQLELKEKNLIIQDLTTKLSEK